MIQLSRLNGSSITVNPYQIEFMEETPDTIILFQSGHKMVVKDRIKDIENKVTEFLGRSIALGIKKSKEA